MRLVQVAQLECKNPTCKHVWFQRGKQPPRICPKCKSARWNEDPEGPDQQRLSKLEQRMFETFRKLQERSPKKARAIMDLIDADLAEADERQAQNRQQR